METNNTNEHPDSSYRIVLSTIKGTFFFLPEQIIRLEASSNYTRIFFSNHYPLISSRVLKEYQQKLEPYGFLRTHQSHLVNKKLVTKVDEMGKIIMQDLSSVEISRRKRAHVMKALKNMAKHN